MICKKKILAFCLIVSMLIGNVGFCFSVLAEDAVHSVVVNSNKYYLSVGESYTPTVTKTPSDLSITWRSSNSSIASVSQNGTITGVSAGYVSIGVQYLNENGYNTITKVLDLFVVDTVSLENNEEYYIANTQSGRLLAPNSNVPYDYVSVTTLLDVWQSRTQWRLYPKSNGGFHLLSFGGSGSLMKAFGTNIEVETEEGVSDEIFYVYRVTEGEHKGTYQITNNGKFVTQSTSNGVYLSETATEYSYWSFMKVEKRYAEIYAFDYPGYSTLGQVNNFLDTFYNLGYDTASNVNSDPDNVIESLTEWDDVLVYRGHGTPGALTFFDDYGEDNGLLAADINTMLVNAEYISSIPYNGLSSLRCVMYLGCTTGVQKNGYDLVTSTYEKGAHFVLGTTMKVYVDDSNNFLEGFLEECSNGGTIYDACEFGKYKAGIDYECYGDSGRYPITYIGDQYQKLEMS